LLLLLLAAPALLAAGPAPETTPGAGLNAKIRADAPGAQEALDRILARMRKSPLADSLMAEFDRDGSTVTVAFGGTGGLLRPGRASAKRLDGRVSESDPSARPMRIILDSRFAADPELEAPAAAALARELLGRVLEYQRASSSGVSAGAYRLDRDGETYARLVAWIAGLELGESGESSDLRRFLDDEDAYRRESVWSSPEEGLGLSLEEMQDPDAAYLARLQVADEVRAENKRASDHLAWLARAADHFVAAHGIDAARFSDLRAELRHDGELAARRAGDIEKVAGALRRQEADLRSGALGDLISELSGERAQAFFRGIDAKVQALTPRARALLPPVVSVPAPAEGTSGPIDRAGLMELYENDAASHQEFWLKAGNGD
jgi:hypothetical protein